MNSDSRQKLIELDNKITKLREEYNVTPDTDVTQRLRRNKLQQEILQHRTTIQLVLASYPKPFYFYLLPLEMLEAIFQNVTSPADKIVLLRTFPILGPLMKWDASTLYFELIYPLIHPYISQNWRDSFALCKVSPAFKDIVLSHFYNLTSATQQSKLHFSTDWNNRIEDLDFHANLRASIAEVEESENSQWPWINNMPFLFGFLYDEPLLGYRNERHAVQGFLQKYGERFLSCYIYIEEFQDEDGEDEEAWNNDGQVNAGLVVINEFVDLMPNLLYLGGMPWNNFLWWGHIAQFMEELENFPQDIWRFPNIGRIKFLQIGLPPSLPNSGIANMTQLEECWLDNCSFNFDAMFRTLFWSSPLKYLRVTMDGVGNQLPDFLLLLNHFGGTLEKLDITCIMINPAESPDKNWALGLNLPKLHFLQIRGYMHSLEFLLAIPSLQVLSLRYNQSNTGEFSADLFKLPWRESRKHETQVWKHLTSLKSLQIWTTNRESGCDERFWTFRSEYDEHCKKSHQSFLGRVISFLS